MIQSKLVICGSIAIDRIMDFSNSYTDLIKPEKIHVLSISVFLDKLIDTYGGVAANICYTLALLGEKPILVGSVGPNCNDYIKKLSDIGIDTADVFFSKLPTASFNVITDKDNNQVGGFYPGAMMDSDNQTLKKYQGQNVLITIAPHDPKAMKRQVKECKDLGLRLFYDVSQQVSNIDSEDITEGVEAAELLIVNDYEFNVICEKTGKTADEIKSMIPVVVITKGHLGSTIEGKNVKEIINIPSAKPNKVVDPTGAGDAFRSGFLYGYARGLDLDICGKLGSVSAVYALEKHGTQEHSFTKEEFSQRFKENFGIECPILDEDI